MRAKLGIILLTVFFATPPAAQELTGTLQQIKKLGRVRIGINLGDVIQEDGCIFGDGVNIAARLEGLSDPGGICISKTAFD